MQKLQAELPIALKTGQIWQVNNRYIYISEVGKKLVHYRMMKSLSQRAAPSHVASRQELLAYLNRFQAQETQPPAHQ